MIAVVATIHKRLSADKRVANPIEESEDLNRIADEDWDAFFTRLTLLQDAAQNANEAADEAAAALAWSIWVAFLMPLQKRMKWKF